MEDKIRQLIGYAFLAMIIAIGMLCVYLEYTQGMDANYGRTFQQQRVTILDDYNNTIWDGSADDFHEFRFILYYSAQMDGYNLEYNNSNYTIILKNYNDSMIL